MSFAAWHALAIMGRNIASTAVSDMNIDIAPATAHPTRRKSRAFPRESFSTFRPMICATPVSNIAVPTTIAPTKSTMMLLENPENTESSVSTPVKTIRTQPRTAVTQLGTHSVRNKTMQTKRMPNAITAEDMPHSLSPKAS